MQVQNITVFLNGLNDNDRWLNDNAIFRAKGLFLPLRYDTLTLYIDVRTTKKGWYSISHLKYLCINHGDQRVSFNLKSLYMS